MEQRRMAERKEFHQSFDFGFSALQSGKSRSRMHKAQGVDISPLGLGLLTDCALSQGAVLRLMLPAEGTETAVPVFAEVAWVTPVGEHFRAGLTFLR